MYYMKQYSPIKNYIIPLNNILKNDQNSINIVNKDLCTRGYAFIRLPLDLISKIKACLVEIEHFFNKMPNYKKQFNNKNIFGYFDVLHKESFRFLTGKRLK